MKEDFKIIALEMAKEIIKGDRKVEVEEYLKDADVIYSWLLSKLNEECIYREEKYIGKIYR